MTSIYVYLTDGIRQLPGFTTVRRQTFATKHAPGQQYDEYSVSGLKVYQEAGRWHASLGETATEIPVEVRGCAVGLSYQANFPMPAPRESGIYRFETAELELEVYSCDSCMRYTLKGTANDLAHLHNLVRQIKAGTIRPVESHEAGQTGKSKIELEAEVAELRSNNGRLASEVADLRQSHKEMVRLQRKMERFEALAESYRIERWPWCSAKEVAVSITETLRRTEDTQVGQTDK